VRFEADQVTRDAASAKWAALVEEEEEAQDQAEFPQSQFRTAGAAISRQLSILQLAAKYKVLPRIGMGRSALSKGMQVTHHTTHLQR